MYKETAPKSSSNQADLEFGSFIEEREAEKARQLAKEQKDKLIGDIVGDAVPGDDRFDEGLAYYKHLERINNETDEEREARHFEASDNEMLSGDWDEAHAENATREEAIRNERIASNKNLAIAERAAAMAVVQHEKLAGAIEANDEEAIEKIEERIESAIELIESQQANDREENGDTNDDIFTSFVNKIQEQTTEANPALSTSNEIDNSAEPTAETEDDEPEEAEQLDIEEFAIPNDGGAEWKAVEPETEDGIDLPEMKRIDLPTTIASENNEATPQVEDEEAKPVEVNEQIATATPWYRRALDKLRKNKDSDNKNEKRSNKRAFSILAIGAVAAGVVLGANYLHNNDSRNQETSTEYPDDYGDSDKKAGNHEADANKETLAKEREALMKAEAWNIPEGGGGEQLMQSLGLQSSEWYTGDLANKLLNRFPESFYQEGNDVRIANAGELPDDIKTFIIDSKKMLN